MVRTKTYESRIPRSPKLDKVTVSFDKLNNTDLCHGRFRITDWRGSYVKEGSQNVRLRSVLVWYIGLRRCPGKDVLLRRTNIKKTTKKKKKKKNI